jgi:lia operon protein LiaF
MRTSTVIGFVLVVAGTLYFLGELGLVHVSGHLWSAGVVWPLVFVLLGLGRFKPFHKGHISVWPLYLIVLGLALSARNSGYVSALTQVSGWGLAWALFFVFLGIQLLTPRRHRHHSMKLPFRVGGETVDIPSTDRADTDSEKKPKSVSDRRWIGDISVGRNAWTLQDMELWNYIGDVRVNLATAHVEDGTYDVKIGGWIGDVRVLVPSHLAVRVDASVGMGDLTVFNEDSSGTGRRVQFEDPAFTTEKKRMILRIDLKLGDVQVVRV